MALFRRKPTVVEAVQWFKRGDHPKVYRDLRQFPFCRTCGAKVSAHGWILTPAGGASVCPGDYIITREDGACYNAKPDYFEREYEPHTTPAPPQISAAQRIALLLEDQMNDLGLTEEERCEVVDRFTEDIKRDLSFFTFYRQLYASGMNMWRGLGPKASATDEKLIP